MPTVKAKGWHTLLAQWTKDAQLWLFIVASLFLFRLILIATFSQQITTSSISDFITALWMGLRFDISTASVWLAPTFLLALLCTFLPISRLLSHLRHGVAYIYLLSASFLLAADLLFFRTYGDHFNQLVFALFYDDTQAILTTIWKEYHPILFTIFIGSIVYIGAKSINRWINHTPSAVQQFHSMTPSILHKGATIFVALLLFVVALRGGTVSGEPLLLKHAFVSSDLFLNRTIPNPLTSLRETIDLQRQLSSSKGFEQYWPNKTMRSAIQAAFPNKSSSSINNLKQGLIHQANSTGKEKPQHIFLVLMESHSGWTVHPSYRAMGFSPEISALAEKGVYFPNFLHSASGTIGSLNAILTGHPDAGLQINYEPRSSINSYPTAIASNFAKLGYKTRFFYGGFIGWQRIDAILKAQGFDEFYGAGNMSTSAATNEWGVDDKDLFSFVKSITNNETATFNFILTTSNHPPYDIDLEKAGFPVKKLPDELTATKQETLKVLGHLWYADQQVGKFVRETTQNFPKSLFAITGDHTARLQIRFPGDNVMEHYTVPFVLYGPETLKETYIDTTVAGSHTDISATLFDIAAPTGFNYYSFGESLFQKGEEDFAFGFGHIANQGNIAHLGQANKPYTWPNIKEQSSVDFQKGKIQYQALRALAWHQIKRGDDISEP